VESLSNNSGITRLLHYNELLILKQNIPNAISATRLVALPHLVYAFNHQSTSVVYALFLFAIGTDIMDGYFARKTNSVSKLGAYLDVTFDFVFIMGMYLNFTINGIYSPWILLIIVSVFAQFIISNVYIKKTIYDPIGKYYGSILFAGIGATLLFSGQLTYALVTYGIVLATLASLASRLTYFINQRKKKLTGE